MPETVKDIKDKPFAQKVREFFGYPEPGQKKLTQKELEKQIRKGKIPKKAEEIK